MAIEQKDEIIHVRVSKTVGNRLRAKHPRKYSTVLRMLLYDYLDGKIKLQVNDAVIPGTSKL